MYRAPLKYLLQLLVFLDLPSSAVGKLVTRSVESTLWMHSHMVQVNWT